jgi:hypothetical protein
MLLPVHFAHLDQSLIVEVAYLVKLAVKFAATVISKFVSPVLLDTMLTQLAVARIALQIA